jgi:hypothetical protein
MNQKSILEIAAMLALMATVVTLVPQAFAQNVTNEGVEEDDDTTNISSTPTKVKSAANLVFLWPSSFDVEMKVFLHLL